MKEYYDWDEGCYEKATEKEPLQPVWKSECMNTKVDMVEVVRCKDCIHWDKGHTEECENSDSVCFHNGWCKPDWFCADGERSE